MIQYSKVIGPKPERPFHGFKKFCKHMGLLTPYGKENPYPCINCRGNGEIVDPEEMPDVVEGHKMSKRIQCPKCEGGGTSDEETLRVAYTKVMKDYKAKLAKWNELKAGVDTIRNTLSPQELFILGLD